MIRQGQASLERPILSNPDNSCRDVAKTFDDFSFGFCYRPCTEEQCMEDSSGRSMWGVDMSIKSIISGVDLNIGVRRDLRGSNQIAAQYGSIDKTLGFTVTG